MHSASKITAKDRVSEFGKENFHCDGGILFCSACNKAIDHTRCQTIKDHLDSKKHSEALKRKASSSEGPSTKRQHTITGLIQRQTSAKDTRDGLVFEIVQMLTQANIPLEKADHPSVRKFLVDHVHGGGTIPTSIQLRNLHLPRLIAFHEFSLRQLITNESYIALITDETSDFQNRPVLNILVQILLPVENLKSNCEIVQSPLLAKSVYLDSVNHRTVSQALIQFCVDYQLDCEKILLLVTDGPSYMKKAWNDLLSVVWKYCYHLQCFAHIAALAGNTWRLSFHDVDQCVALLKSVLVKAPSRRNRFLGHLKDSGIESPVVPPNPVVTRWNTWFDTVEYHSKYVEYYTDFVRNERENEMETVALKNLSQILSTAQVKERLVYTAKHCSRLIQSLDNWQSRKHQIHCVFNDLNDLVCWLERQAECANTECREGPRSAAEKLKEYCHAKKQSAIPLLNKIRALDPQQVTILDMPYSSVKEVLHFADESDDE